MTTNSSNIQEINSGTPPVTPLQILKTYFGYDSFREGQTEIIDTILSGRDALAIMPTGAGKSLCYQVPALLLPGITLNIINLRLDITHLYYPAKNSFQKGRLKRREIFTELLLYTLTT